MNKFLVILSVVLGLLLTISLFMYNKEINRSKLLTSEIQIKQKQLNDSIIRSSNEVVTKEYLNSLLKESKIDLSPLQQDINRLNSKIDSVNQIRIISTPQVVTNLPSTKEEKKPDQDKVETNDQYLKNKQIIDLYENFGVSRVPIGNAGFSAWRKNPWEYNIYQRQYTITNVITKTEDDKTVVYNKFTINSNNQDYEVKVSESKTYQVNPESKFKLYPKIFLTATSGIDSSKAIDTSVNLKFSALQYGQFYNYPKYTFANIGIGYSTNGIRFSLAPIYYRLDLFGFVKNLYIGPDIGINQSKVVDIGLSIGVSF